MKKYDLSVKLLSIDNIDVIVSNKLVSRIYIEADDFISHKGIKFDFDGEIYIVFPDVLTTKALKLIDDNYDYIIAKSQGILIHNLDSLFYLKDKSYDLSKVVASERLYAYNSSSIEFYRENGLHNFTYPVELTFKEGEDICFGKVEEIVYGRTALMVSSGCVHKNTTKCDQIKQNLILKDRKKMDFFVQNRCEYCYNVTYNSVPTMIMDELSNIHKDASSVRIDLTFENKDQIKKILDLYEACCYGNCPAKEEIRNVLGEYTRGHYHKGMIS